MLTSLTHYSSCSPSSVVSAVICRPVDPTLEQLGLPQYPKLPANTESSKVEEIRRTVYVGNLPKGVDGKAVLDFFNMTIGEVMYVRLTTGSDQLPCAYAFVEFSSQTSVPIALQNNMMIDYEGRTLKIQHSRVAIIKPQRKTADQALEEVEEAIRKKDSGINYMVARSRSRSVSRRREPARERERRRSRTKSPKRRSRTRSPRRRSRSKERERRRSRSRERERETKRRSRSRSRDRDRRRRSRSRDRVDRDRERERERRRSRSRDRSRERKERDRSRERRREKDRKDKDRKRSRSRTPKKFKDSKRDRDRSSDRKRDRKDRDKEKEKDKDKEKKKSRKTSDKKESKRKEESDSDINEEAALRERLLEKVAAKKGEDDGEVPSKIAHQRKRKHSSSDSE